MRNGADVVLKSLFLSFGGQHGLLAFNALLLGAGVVLVGRDLRKSRQGLQGGIFLGMVAESAVGGLSSVSWPAASRVAAAWRAGADGDWQGTGCLRPARPSS